MTVMQDNKIIMRILYVIVLLLKHDWKVNAEFEESAQPQKYTDFSEDEDYQENVNEQDDLSYEALQNQLVDWQDNMVQQALTKTLDLELWKKTIQNCLGHSNHSKPYYNLVNISQMIITIEKNNSLKQCVLKDKWYKALPASGAFQFRKGSTHGAMLNFVRITDPIYQEHQDCLYKSRVRMRRFPGDCYAHTFGEDDWRKEEFWAWWGQVYGDILFAFDFVMYDAMNPERKENQFWYLIAYLRILTLYVSDPIKIATCIHDDNTKYKEVFREYKSRLSNVKMKLKVLTSVEAAIITSKTARTVSLVAAKVIKLAKKLAKGRKK